MLEDEPFNKKVFVLIVIRIDFIFWLTYHTQMLIWLFWSCSTSFLYHSKSSLSPALDVRAIASPALPYGRHDSISYKQPTSFHNRFRTPHGQCFTNRSHTWNEDARARIRLVLWISSCSCFPRLRYLAQKPIRRLGPLLQLLSLAAAQLWLCAFAVLLKSDGSQRQR